MDEGEHTLVTLMRAGLMRMSPEGQLTADPRKGLLTVTQTDDLLTHVMWHPREGAVASGPPLHDIVVFPGECELKEIPGQARIYVLEFKEDATRNMFFWLQQPKATDDAALVANFNKAVNGLPVDPVPAPSQQGAGAGTAVQRAGSGAAAAGGAAGQQDMGALLRQFFSNNPPPTTDASGQVDPTRLAASLLSQLAGKGQLQMRQHVDQGPGLHEVLKPDLLVPLVRKEGMLDKLASHLPEEHRTQEQLVATVRSPQFQQQLATFSAAMQTGQLDLAQFGLNAKGFSVADFLTAIQEMVDKEKQQGAGSMQE